MWNKVEEREGRELEDGWKGGRMNAYVERPKEGREGGWRDMGMEALWAPE